MLFPMICIISANHHLLMLNFRVTKHLHINVQFVFSPIIYKSYLRHLSVIGIGLAKMEIGSTHVRLSYDVVRIIGRFIDII